VYGLGVDLFFFALTTLSFLILLESTWSRALPARSFFSRQCYQKILDPIHAVVEAVSVVAASGDQSHAVAVALQPNPVAVVLDLVEPVRAVGDDGRSGGEAELKHAGKINIDAGFREPTKKRPPARGMLGALQSLALPLGGTASTGAGTECSVEPKQPTKEKTPAAALRSLLVALHGEKGRPTTKKRVVAPRPTSLCRRPRGKKALQ
jgi:hypothetical protein